MKKILYIDNNLDDQLIFRNAIDSLQLSTFCKFMSDGKEAMDHLQKISNYDIVFFHLSNPISNSNEFIPSLTRNGKYNHIPVILFNSAFKTSDVEFCQTYGTHRFWQKPDTFEALCKEITGILARTN